MTERIDRLVYTAPTGAAPSGSTREPYETMFLTGPAEFLVRQLAEELKIDPVWSRLFGDMIDSYMRMDYGYRNLPAIRIYNERFYKEDESWYINGDVKIDIILPPAIRRNETQQMADTLASAMIQQFRRKTFYHTLRDSVPGLNQLGKSISCDKAMAFQFDDDVLCPLVQIMVNFRMDLAEWDRYIESDDRTTDDPFNRTLGDLELIATTIEGLREDAVSGFAPSIEIEMEQIV